jgi:hypothetical protein
MENDGIFYAIGNIYGHSVCFTKENLATLFLMSLNPKILPMNVR